MVESPILGSLSAGSGHIPQFGRFDPTLRPIQPWWPGLVAVTDTNALASRACHAVRLDQLADRLFGSLALTGRSPIYVASHIPNELVKRLPEIAESAKVDFAAAWNMLRGPVTAGVRVVELEIGDHLAPGIRPILTADRALPKRLRGDPDDLGTAALAEFLAPVVILSADSVFMRFGLANCDARSWVACAYRLLELAGIEATVGDMAALAELGAQLTFLGLGKIIGAARRAPWAVAAVAAALGVIMTWTGNARLEPWRQRLRALIDALQPFLESGAEALLRRGEALSQLMVVQESALPTTIHRAARHLARRGTALTPAELCEELASGGCRIPATRLREEMVAHRAFVRWRGDRYTVGRPLDLATVDLADS